MTRYQIIIKAIEALQSKNKEEKQTMVNIEGLDKAKVLKALYDGSHIQGLGFLQAVDSFTEEDARELLSETTYFDYLYGRVLKVDLSSDIEFNPRLYDRDNYEGKAQDIIDMLRRKK